MRHILPRLVSRSLILLVGIGLAACGGDDTTASASDRGVAREESERRSRYGADAGAMDMQAERSAPPSPAPSTPVAPSAPGDRGTTGQDSLPASMLIRTGFVRLEVETLDPAVEAVQAMVAGLDGLIVNIAIEGGREEVRSATITARIPAPRFDRALESLEPLGEVESVRVQAEDVGEQYADLEARNRNALRLEQRLLELLETRTGSLEDVLAVERELARVRGEIERHEGRMRYLRNRVAMSTLTLTLHEPEPLFSAERPGQNVLATSLRQAGRNFMALLGGLIASLGFVLPILLLLAVAWWLVRRRRSRRRVNGSTPTTPPGV